MQCSKNTLGMAERKKGRFSAGRIAVHTIMILLVLLCALPFVLVISTSFASKRSIMQYGYTFFPHELSLDAYKYILSDASQIVHSYALTVFVACFGTAVGVLFMTMFAYAISRDDFRLKNSLSLFIYFPLLFNGGMVSNYIWISGYLKLSNTVWALILPIMITPFYIFILRISCRNIPVSLIENAKMEGAGELRIFLYIIIPLIKTGIATVSLLQFFNYWNEWFSSMMYMDGNKLVTLQYFLVRVFDSIEFAKANIGSSGGLINLANLPDDSIRMAICVLVAGPMLCIFPFFQKYFVKGVAVGAVKG